VKRVLHYAATRSQLNTRGAERTASAVAHASRIGNTWADAVVAAVAANATVASSKGTRNGTVIATRPRWKKASIRLLSLKTLQRTTRWIQIQVLSPGSCTHDPCNRERTTNLISTFVSLVSSRSESFAGPQLTLTS
jgi:hypothetical protein